MCAFVVVDPIFSGGEHSRSWRLLAPQLAKLYPYMSLAFPKRRSEMGPLVSTALREGHTEIVAVGCRRLDETINGFFNTDGSLSPDAVLAVLPSGSSAIAHLGQAVVRSIDVGRVHFLSSNGEPCTRYFAAQAVCGRPADLLSSLFGYRGWTIRLKVDQEFDEIVAIRAVSINNRPMFGAAGQIAPAALAGTGEFDVAIVRAPDANAITRVRGQKITAAPVEQTLGRPVAITLDGQNVGRLPATFEILPRALNVRC